MHNTMQILGAGHDTTATSLALLLWQLALDSDLQEAVRAEVRSGSPHRSGDGDVDATKSSAVFERPLLSACIREVLRMWPAAPLIVRQALEPAPSWEGLSIPTGTVAIVAPWLLGRSAQYWEEPAHFRPRQNWVSSQEGKSVQRHPFSWIPFGYGMRSCVGQHLAVAELEEFAAALLRRMRFTVAAQEPHVEWFLTLRLRDGLQLHVEPVV